MVYLFQRFSITISSHNHLVEIKCNAEGPNEVRNKEIVKDHCAGYTEDAIIHIEGEVEEDLCEENAGTEVDNQFDRVGAHVGEDYEGNDCAKASK